MGLVWPVQSPELTAPWPDIRDRFVPLTRAGFAWGPCSFSSLSLPIPHLSFLEGRQGRCPSFYPNQRAVGWGRSELAIAQECDSCNCLGFVQWKSCLAPGKHAAFGICSNSWTPVSDRRNETSPFAFPAHQTPPAFERGLKHKEIKKTQPFTWADSPHTSPWSPLPQAILALQALLARSCHPNSPQEQLLYPLC